MSIFSVNKAAKSRALTAENQAAQERNSLQLMEFGRDLLQNIRQERVARSQLEFSNYIEGVNTSSAAGAIANVDSGLAAEVGYAYRYSAGLERMQQYQETATRNWEQYAKSVQRATRNAKIAGSVMSVGGQIVGTALGGPVGGAIGSAIGSLGAVGITSAMGGGSIAGRAAFSSGFENTMNYIGSNANSIASSFSSPKQDDTKRTYEFGNGDRMEVQFDSRGNTVSTRMLYNSYNPQITAEARRLVP